MYNDIVQRYKDANPMWSFYQGFHEYDGILIDLDQGKIDERVSQIQADIAKLREMEEPEEKTAKFNYNLIIQALESELFEKNSRKEFIKSPMPYLGPLNVIESIYTTRSFASIDSRIDSIIKIQKDIPRLLQQARENLELKLARPKVERSIQFCAGLTSYFGDKLIDFIIQATEKSVVQTWSEINLTAVEAIKSFKKDLEENYLPEAHDNYALGEEAFLEMLEKTESVKTTYEELEKIGREALKKDKDDLLSIAKSKGMTIQELKKWAYEDRPAPEELIGVVSKMNDDLLDFFQRTEVVSLPSTEQIIVKDYPASVKSFALAGMMPPAPFDPPQAKEAFYYVNIPTPDMPKEQQEMLKQFFNTTQLLNISIHEGWPGHYLQLLYNNTSDNKIALMFATSYSMIEGWGLYTEQLLCEVNYDKYDPVKLKVAQLDLSLLRTGRYLCAINMHCRGMTIEESTQMFVNDCLVEEEIARNQSIRGTMDPMFLNYTLGKLMILKLRDDYKKEQGNKYSLKKFHDTMLSYASPPITVLRKMILENPNGSIL